MPRHHAASCPKRATTLWAGLMATVRRRKNASSLLWLDASTSCNAHQMDRVPTWSASRRNDRAPTKGLAQALEPSAIGEKSHGVKALLFDMFGTVLDWRTGVARSVEAILKPRGYELDWFACVSRTAAIWSMSSMFPRALARSSHLLR